MPTSRSRLGRLGGIAFVNLEGLYTRYEDAAPIIERVAAAEDGGPRPTCWPRPTSGRSATT